ncbi:hypothetical protein SLG_11860 [Sphingobium sp. SYK-6]|uniref:putative 2OG-Fe(II) oxygenase n=1 Tax=Sphingobium sp. (strain NBRC 103272 / SYK-6) TaxID=627192 RepID=UPI0002277182|nr:putative 2OG-Fe(II) oxygenase [Sphingobium sp. SYK-6]BAK65861.1 hypothetical protein SLG_11860 [Sphingobium sp. SYK-6]
MSTGPSPHFSGDLQRAVDLMRQGRLADAERLLETAARQAPQDARPHFFLALALRHRGDAAGATRELALALDLDPLFQDAAVELARLLNAGGEPERVIALTGPAAAVARPAEALLVERARAFQALDRPEERLAERERIVALYPARSSAYHNLAAALGDAGHAQRAEAAARQAFALGGKAPETWLVLARALQGQNRLDEAEQAFRRAVALRPSYVEALRDLAQLRWMRTGRLDAALAELAPGLATEQAGRLRMVMARFHDAAGDAATGYRLLTQAGGPGSAETESAAAQLAIGFDPERALAHALRAEALAPASGSIRHQVIDALLATGQPQQALDRIETQLALTPLDQGLIAAQWTAWRLLGDGRADALYDYDAFVSAMTIEPPPGWSSLPDYLGDLAASLRSLHGFTAHPLDQSLRSGTQTSADLLRSDDPAIRGFRTAIDGAIRRYVEILGAGSDPFRARRRGGYRLKGMWSVRLSPGGFHVDHVHPQGWISSACYIALPDGMDDEEARAGWIRFGQPGIPTAPPLEAGHFVRPQPGMLVLFPSYMWHGTVPCPDGGDRLTIAFDVLPEDAIQ